MKRKKKAVVSEKVKLGESNCCPFCNSDENNELLYGEIKPTYKLNAHFFCLLFSSGLNQRGRDNQGIYGFLLKDIEKELIRGKRLACSYCKKPGATIGCGKKDCSKKFHLPCGRRYGSLHQFFGCFESYCSQHKPKQNKIKINDEDICVICHENLVSDSTKEVLNSPCCINSKYHFNCLQSYAIHAGDIHFRCPKCQNVDKFKKEMLTYGVYVPDQDASWEREENAFQELLVRHDVCNYTKCLCPKGRKYQDERQWLLVLCKCCGSQGCHAACGKIPVRKPSWVCKECYSIVCKTNLKKPEKASVSSNSSNEASTSTSNSCATLSRTALKPCFVVLAKLPNVITNSLTENCDQESYEMYIQGMNADVDKASDSEAGDVDIITIESDDEIDEETTLLSRLRSNEIDNKDDEVVVLNILDNQASLRGATSGDKGTDSISESSIFLIDIDDESFENVEYIKAIKSMSDTVKLVDHIDIVELLSEKSTWELNHPAPNSSKGSMGDDSNEILLENEMSNVRAENRKKRKYTRRLKLQNEENAKPKSVGRSKRKIGSNNGNYNDGISDGSPPKVLKTMVNLNDECPVDICNNDADSPKKIFDRNTKRGISVKRGFSKAKKISKAVKLVNRSETHRKKLHINQLRSKNSSFTRYSMTEEENRTISNLIEGKVGEIINICNDESLINSSFDNKEKAHTSRCKFTGTNEKDNEDNNLTKSSESEKTPKPSNNSVRREEKKSKKKVKCKGIILENENKFSKVTKICKDCNVCENLKSHFHCLKMDE